MKKKWMREGGKAAFENFTFVVTFVLPFFAPSHTYRRRIYNTLKHGDMEAKTCHTAV
jgi:hypothetical protein